MLVYCLQHICSITIIQNIANTLWAFATLEFRSDRLFEGLIPRVRRQASEAAATGSGGGGDASRSALGPQALSNITWAYAKAGMVSVGLLMRAWCFLTS
jgi:hypothetical protein